MSKFRLSLIVAILAAFCMPAMAGDKVVKRVPAGAVAFHFVFDLSFATEPPEFVGYVAFIEGVDGDLFAAYPPSQHNAYFTVRVTRPLPPPIGGLDGLPVPDTHLTARVYPPGGQFTVFYNSSPSSRDWSEPGDFEQGVPIAVFDESALLSTEANAWLPGVSFGTFSSRLIDSTPIRFNGQKIDFRKLVRNGVTITNFGNSIRFAPGPGVSGGGTAIAIGGKGWHKSDDADSDD